MNINLLPNTKTVDLLVSKNTKVSIQACEDIKRSNGAIPKAVYGSSFKPSDK